MELYDAIFYRKSTRKYSNKKVKEGLLEEVKNACSQITYLNKELDINVKNVVKFFILILNLLLMKIAILQSL